MIQRTRGRLWTCSVLLGLNLLFIWGNSLMPGNVSGALSDWLRDLLALLFGKPSGGSGGGFLRKLAHFTEFACLGLLLSWLIRMLCRKALWFYTLPLLLGAAAAGVDELIQCFVPNRGPGLVDVLIDSTGTAMGIFVFFLVYFLHKRSILHSEE